MQTSFCKFQRIKIFRQPLRLPI